MGYKVKRKPSYDKRALQRVAFVLLFYVVLLFLLSLFPSCTTTKYVPVETVRTETLIKTDSTEINRLIKELAEVKQTLSSTIVERIEQTTTYIVSEKGDTIATNKERNKEVITDNSSTIEANRAIVEEETKNATSNYLKEKTDTISNIVEVEKELTAWQKFKINFSEFIIGVAVLAISAFIVLLIIFRRNKK